MFKRKPGCSKLSHRLHTRWVMSPALNFFWERMTAKGRAFRRWALAREARWHNETPETVAEWERATTALAAFH